LDDEAIEEMERELFGAQKRFQPEIYKLRIKIISEN
jgi:hypothetical protein